MFSELARALVKKAIESGAIEAADEEIYFFGAKMFFSQSLHLGTFILMAVYANLLWEGLCFFFAYMGIRINAGGWHAPSNLICFCSSTLTNLLVLLLLFYTPLHLCVSLGLLFCMLSVLVIRKYAPVENPLVPMDEVEKKVYRARSLYGTALICTLALGAVVGNLPRFAYSLGLALLTESALLLICILQRRE